MVLVRNNNNNQVVYVVNRPLWYCHEGFRPHCSRSRPIAQWQHGRAQQIFAQISKTTRNNKPSTTCASEIIKRIVIIRNKEKNTTHMSGASRHWRGHLLLFPAPGWNRTELLFLFYAGFRISGRCAAGTFVICMPRPSGVPKSWKRVVEPGKIPKRNAR